MSKLVPELKDRAIFLGWLAGLVLAGALIWSFSFSFRANCLLRSVNRALIAAADQRRLLAPLERPAAKPAPLGIWYSLVSSDSRMFVFAIIRDGILLPCGAEVSPAGTVVDIIPLGVHAGRAMGRLPPGILRMYTRRIETVAAEGERK
jgi:hypothetical protein